MAAACETIDVLVPPPPAGGLAWRRWLSVAANTRRPVLVGLIAGESAQRWAAMSDAQIVSSAMAALAAAFPGRAPAAPRSHLVSRWGSDPWARGALSYPAAGGRGPNDRATLGEPMSGSLLLAGEAVWAEQAGTVHGAMLSGGWRLGAWRVDGGGAMRGPCTPRQEAAVRGLMSPRCQPTHLIAHPSVQARRRRFGCWMPGRMSCQLAAAPLVAAACACRRSGVLCRNASATPW